MLNAPALAAFQVLIYVGAVTVVILFGIMFTQKPQVRRYRTIINRQFWAGFLVAVGVGAFLAYVLSAEDWGGAEAGNGPRQVGAFGRDLLGVSQGLRSSPCYTRSPRCCSSWPSWPPSW